MIYVDTLVILAHLLAEDRSPPDAVWGQTLVSSRLTHSETWTRLHARRLGQSHGDLAREALGRPALATDSRSADAATRLGFALHPL